MKYVVIYYSFTGNNEKLALHLQRRLDCDSVVVTEAHSRTRLTILLDVLFGRTPAVSWTPCDLSRYGRVILVGPVWARHVATPLAEFIARRKDDLPAYAFLSLCDGLPGQPERIEQELLHLIGRRPELVDQLNLNDLLPPEHKYKEKYMSAVRVSDSDMRAYDAAIDRFLITLEPGLELRDSTLPASWHASVRGTPPSAPS